MHLQDIVALPLPLAAALARAAQLPKLYDTDGAWAGVRLRRRNRATPGWQARQAAWHTGAADN